MWRTTADEIFETSTPDGPGIEISDVWRTTADEIFETSTPDGPGIEISDVWRTTADEIFEILATYLQRNPHSGLRGGLTMPAARPTPGTAQTRHRSARAHVLSGKIF